MKQSATLLPPSYPRPDNSSVETARSEHFDPDKKNGNQPLVSRAVRRWPGRPTKMGQNRSFLEWFVGGRGRKNRDQIDSSWSGMPMAGSGPNFLILSLLSGITSPVCLLPIVPFGLLPRFDFCVHPPRYLGLILSI